MEQISNNRCFLLSGSIAVKPSGLESEYCYKRDVSIERSTGIPVVLNINHLVTGSKTLSYASDDDPDPEVETCY